jgi:TRAP-type C4-dicarboxylate transport system permease small subunit
MYYGFIMIEIQMNVPYAGIKISTAWGYLSVVLGCGLFIARAIVYFIEALKCVVKGDVQIEGGVQ